MARLTLYTRRRLARFSTSSSPLFFGAGYFGGGNLVSPTNNSSNIIDKLSFLDESRSTLAATLVTAVRFCATVSNTGTAGYFAGGSLNASSSRTNQISKIAFSNESVSLNSSNLTENSTFQSGASNGQIAGYIFGGLGTAGVGLSSADKILYSSGSVSKISGALTTAVLGAAPASNSGVAAYIAGGRNNGGSIIATINKMTYSNDTAVPYSQTLSQTSGSLAGLENKNIAGYFINGASGSTYRIQTNKILYSTDAISSLGSTMSAFQVAGSFSRDSVCGYVGGGQNSSGRISAISKITFSSDTFSNIAATLSVARTTSGLANNG